MTFDWTNPRGLCLNPPYGICVAVCEKHPDLGKHIETRGYWPYTWKGTLLIHQTKGLGEMFEDEADLADHCAEWPFCEALESLGYTRASDLPRGKIVAVARLIARVTMTERNLEDGYFIVRTQQVGDWLDKIGGAILRSDTRYATWPIPGRQRAMGFFKPGRAGILLADIVALPEPVTCRGVQGLWVPDAATVAAVRAQVAG